MRSRSARAWLATAGISASLLAGCVGAPAEEQAVEPAAAAAPLPPVAFPVLPGQSVWIEASSDGTKLHARLFLPETSALPEWNAPTILVMSPYFGHDARTDSLDPASPPNYFRYQWLIDNFVPKGYALVFADVRGTGDSGGCLEQTAQLQWKDGYDVVEWLGTQDWSSGKVGMFGKSYDAETQQSTAVMAPPHLATIVPVSSVSGQYEYGFYDGVPFTLQAFLSNLFYMVGDGLQAPTTPEGIVQYPTRPGCHPEMLAQGLDFSGDWNQFWEDREIRKRAADVKASVLYVHGLQDWNVKPVAIRDWFGLIPSEKRAILGQWAHDYPEQNRYKPDWSRADWRETVEKWYDHWLLGIDNGILQELAPVQVQDSSGVWRREETFPPTDAVPVTLHLATGKLQHEAPTPFELQLRENEEAFLAANTGLPVPEAPTDPLLTKLAFESEPLTQGMHLSGWPVLTFRFTLTDSLKPERSSLDPHFAAVLYDVDSSGKAGWFNRGYLSARHRQGVESPEPTPFQEEIEYVLRFFPADTLAPAGHKLRLEISGSDAWTQPEGSLWAGTLSGGRLDLPVIQRDWDAVRLDVPFGDPIDH